MSKHLGSCRCGGVVIEATDKVHFTGYCHCDDCRRSNGAPVVAFAGFESDQFKWTNKEALSQWRNGEFGRLFCKSCGSPVAYTDGYAPDVTFFYVGFMEEKSAFPPAHHSYYQEKISWLKLADDLPRFNETSYPRPGE